MNLLSLEPPPVQPIYLPILHQPSITADVLRLDKVHPAISGNKWYKLKEYMHMAVQQHKKAIITFGGAFSNHIHATAAACQAYGLPAAGIIRGEKPTQLSPTLTDVTAWGMELFFVSRAAYKEKQVPPEVSSKYSDALLINEGGYGPEGMRGAMDILPLAALSAYTHIIAAVGTGTTLAGLVKAARPGQQVIGISVLKNNFDLETDIKKLTGNTAHFSLLHDFHFGGYAKATPALIEFMNEWYKATGIPSDFVYTGKLFYAVDQLLQRSFFPPESKLLIIHSGGLQGNRSLKKGTLIF